MSWAIVKNNQVIEILNGAKAVTINGIQYPSSIFGAWTKAELKNIGIYPTQITSTCLLYTSPSPRDVEESRMPSSA